MNNGLIFGSIDVAQIAIWLFWAFFAGLIYYLHREDKREGYPLEDSDASPYSLREGFPAMPTPKTYLLAHGGTVSKPAQWMPGERPPLNAKSAGPWSLEPLEPIGNPLLAGVGPGSWANRPDHPDLTLAGEPKIVPLRVSAHHKVSSQGPDPRGRDVLGADGMSGGIVKDLWVDRSEEMFRYYEIETKGGRHVLVPATFCTVAGDGTLTVRAILGEQFAEAPYVRNPDQITMLEEEKVVAYYGAGTLYATPSRQEPLL